VGRQRVDEVGVEEAVGFRRTGQGQDDGVNAGHDVCQLGAGAYLINEKQI